jgi:hypothetical protein
MCCFAITHHIDADIEMSLPSLEFPVISLHAFQGFKFMLGHASVASRLTKGKAKR